MPIIKLYKTKLDPANRMGTLEEYETYIASIPLQEVEIKYPFVEKNSYLYIKYFNDELANRQYSLYNYALIDGVSGQPVPAFVRLVPLATDGYRVDVRVDYWAKYLIFKEGGINIDLHGKCVRAHVNDWEEYDDTTGVFSKPTLKNTYLTQEESVSMSDLERGTIANTTINIPANYAYIYVYFNNPNQANLSYTAKGGEQSIIQTFFGSQRILEPQLNSKEPKSLQGALACGTINLKTGFCCFAGKIKQGNTYIDITDNLLSCCCYLRDLTNSYITTIYISNIAPYDVVESVGMNVSSLTISLPLIGTVTENVFYPSYEEDYCFTLSYNADSDSSLPKLMFCPTTIDSSTRIRKIDLIGSNAEFIFSDETHDKSLDDFYKSVVKARSFIYNPIMYCNNVFDTLHDSEIEISLSADGRQFIATLSSDILLENERIIRQINNYIFTPDTVKDYWSIMEAERTSLAIEKESAMQWYGVASSALNTVTKTVKGVSTGDVTAITDVVGGIVETGGKALDAALSENIRSIDKEFANAQKQNGVVNSSVPTGYYGSLLYDRNTSLSYYKLSVKSMESVAKQLVRYGYATFLLLEDVLRNHKRTAFNYIQTSQVEIHGCDADLAQDIVSMFQNGVHLWHTNDVGNYDVANYQVNV